MNMCWALCTCLHSQGGGIYIQCLRCVCESVGMKCQQLPTMQVALTFLPPLRETEGISAHLCGSVLQSL